MAWNCIGEVPSLNVGRGRVILLGFSRFFFSVFSGRCQASLDQNMAASFQILSSSSFIILLFDGIYSSIPTASLNNLHKREHCKQLVHKLLRNVLDVDVNFAQSKVGRSLALKRSSCFYNLLKQFSNTLCILVNILCFALLSLIKRLRSFDFQVCFAPVKYFSS